MGNCCFPQWTQRGPKRGSKLETEQEMVKQKEGGYERVVSFFFFFRTNGEKRARKVYRSFGTIRVLLFNRGCWNYFLSER